MSMCPRSSVEALTSDDFLLDVREDDEWEAGHAEGALHIPMSDFVARYGELTEAAPRTAGCTCCAGSAGARRRSPQYLVQQGVDAVNVDGGMQVWEPPAARSWTARAAGFVA